MRLFGQSQAFIRSLARTICIKKSITTSHGADIASQYATRLIEFTKTTIPKYRLHDSPDHPTQRSENSPYHHFTPHNSSKVDLQGSAPFNPNCIASRDLVRLDGTKPQTSVLTTDHPRMMLNTIMKISYLTSLVISSTSFEVNFSVVFHLHI